MPARFQSPPVLAWLAWLVFLALFIQGIWHAQVTPGRLSRGVVNLADWFFVEALPPDFSRIGAVSLAMYETFQMALVGVTLGVIASVPMAILCATNTSPHVLVRIASRMTVATMRTIPDLIWALIFVIAIGLGPLAGILAIMMDTIGFCGRFFSERIEEVKPGPAEALTATGAGRAGVIGGAILPEAFASFVATSLYAVEKAVRSAVVLGLVGAGGIGVELSASMDLWRYDQALTIILVILAVVIAVEQASTRIRKRFI
jgi:phosphonate transport system permease protein